MNGTAFGAFFQPENTREATITVYSSVFGSCPSILLYLKTVCSINNAWETRLEREKLVCHVVRAMTVQSVAIIPLLLIVAPMWPLLQIEGVFCIVCILLYYEFVLVYVYRSFLLSPICIVIINKEL